MNPEALAADITLAVLAGGEGSRMGRPKGEIILRGRPILDDLLDRFTWLGPTLLVTAPGREHPLGWERFDREVSDPIVAGGPLRGVMTALEAVTTPFVAVVTVDMPEVLAAHLHWLAAELAAYPDLLGVMCRRQALGQDQIEPFPSIFRATAKEWVRAQMAGGIRSTYRLSQSAQVKAVPVPPDWPDATWVNLNRPEDLNAYETRNDAGTL